MGMEDTDEGLVGSGDASMGPRSDNRGYDPLEYPLFPDIQASMGPRSDNRGYGDYDHRGRHRQRSFNGSTVR